ncbi:hypothetical protein GDO78_020364 [Eleutherodactylus coqui]|uniref:Uncharacterized protein n=1 Tax=Eleutherodactylus coqui TaxID=57060 RepID=A0A8J6BIE8_ELECQ|nr:hypothetical protein GDO78_020364 [Eleutherodactylus coqui]
MPGPLGQFINCLRPGTFLVPAGWEAVKFFPPQFFSSYKSSRLGNSSGGAGTLRSPQSH